MKGEKRGEWGRGQLLAKEREKESWEGGKGSWVLFLLCKCKSVTKQRKPTGEGVKVAMNEILQTQSILCKIITTNTIRYDVAGRQELT